MALQAHLHTQTHTHTQNVPALGFHRLTDCGQKLNLNNEIKLSSLVSLYDIQRSLCNFAPANSPHQWGLKTRLRVFGGKRGKRRQRVRQSRQHQQQQQQRENEQRDRWSSKCRGNVNLNLGST